MCIDVVVVVLFAKCRPTFAVLGKFEFGDDQRGKLGRKRELNVTRLFVVVGVDCPRDIVVKLSA